MMTVAQAPTVGPPFHGPTINSRRQSVETTDLFAYALQPILRYPDELAEISQEPQSGVAATGTLLHEQQVLFWLIKSFIILSQFLSCSSISLLVMSVCILTSSSSLFGMHHISA